MHDVYKPKFLGWKAFSGLKRCQECQATASRRAAAPRLKVLEAGARGTGQLAGRTSRWLRSRLTFSALACQAAGVCSDAYVKR